MTLLSQDKTVAVKQAFEKFAHDQGNITIKRYHGADNGHFAEEGFCCEIQESNQSITFCGVGAHHQSSIIECGIGKLTEDARTMLLHAQHYWPEM